MTTGASKQKKGLDSKGATESLFLGRVIGGLEFGTSIGLLSQKVSTTILAP